MLEARIKADLVEKQRQVENVSLRQRVSSIRSVIYDPGVLKPLIIINVFNILQLCSGTYVIVFYAVDLVRNIGECGNLDSPSIFTLITTRITTLFILNHLFRNLIQNCSYWSKKRFLLDAHLMFATFFMI